MLKLPVLAVCFFLGGQFLLAQTTAPPVKDSGWFIQPKQTPANKPFTLQLLSYAYGNCQTSFTHTSLDTGSHSLYLSFVVESHPERVCVADIRPYGPSYDVRTLKVGKYPVYAVQHLACEYTNPRCLVAVQPKLVDTLQAMEGSSLLPQQSGLPPRISPMDHLGIIKGYWINGRRKPSLR